MKLSLQKKEVTLRKKTFVVSSVPQQRLRMKTIVLKEELKRHKAEGVYNHIIKNGETTSNADFA